MSKLTKEQTEEIAKCASDFPYFCENYVNILNTKNNVYSFFKLYPYQERLYEHIEDNRFTIFSKFRTGGFTTEIAIYCLWRCLFRLDQRIVWISKNQHEAIDVCDLIVKRAIDHMPDWIKGNVSQMKSSYKKIFAETNSRMFFGTPEAACSQNVNLMIIDEASFINRMESHWRAFLPTISSGRAIIMSTLNSDDNWFWKTLQDAKLRINYMSHYSCCYKEHPEFCKPEWEAKMKQILDKRSWEVNFEQIIAESQLIEKKESKESKKLWRSIFDEWTDSSEIDEGA